MKYSIKFLIVISILTQLSFTQNLDSKLISKKIELNFLKTKMRGIEYHKTIYFLEDDLQNISAYENGKLKWRTNVISICKKPSVGKSEIRYMKLKDNKLIVIYGKHSFAEVNILNGKAEFIGSD